MAWFMKLSIGFLALAFVLFSLVYLMTPTVRKGRSGVAPETESATTSPAEEPEKRQEEKRPDR